MIVAGYGDTANQSVRADLRRDGYYIDDTGVYAPNGTRLGDTNAGGSTTASTPPSNEPRADDGQTLSGQSAQTQADFAAVYGSNAATAWAQQHNAAIHSSTPTPATPQPSGSHPSGSPSVTNPVPPANTSTGSVGGNGGGAGVQPSGGNTAASSLGASLQSTVQLPVVGAAPLWLVAAGAFLGLKALTGGRR